MATTTPTTYKKLQVIKLTADFRAATEIASVPLVAPSAGQLQVRVAYAGTNATDINITAGRYFTDGKVPFDIGFELVGTVTAVGEGVTGYAVGDAVVALATGYTEYSYVDVAKTVVLKIPQAKPEYLGLMVTGLTASIGLDRAGHIAPGEKVLITAAAGATGLICCQWAKLRGCHVIGMTSSDDKATVLRDMGVDRVINYRSEDTDSVLKKEYPDGVDVIWETIGGKTFEMLTLHLARKGRLIIVGGITGYKTQGLPDVNMPKFPGQLLMKSASMVGFLVMDYREDFADYLKDMVTQFERGVLKVLVDNGTARSATKQEFVGLTGAVRAVEHLHTGKNLGKVVTRLN